MPCHALHFTDAFSVSFCSACSITSTPARSLTHRPRPGSYLHPSVHAHASNYTELNRHTSYSDSAFLHLFLIFLEPDPIAYLNSRRSCSGPRLALRNHTPGSSTWHGGDRPFSFLCLALAPVLVIHGRSDKSMNTNQHNFLFFAVLSPKNRPNHRPAGIPRAVHRELPEPLGKARTSGVHCQRQPGRCAPWAHGEYPRHLGGVVWD